MTRSRVIFAIQAPPTSRAKSAREMGHPDVVQLGLRVRLVKNEILRYA
jgi:hypothetical protein